MATANEVGEADAAGNGSKDLRSHVKNCAMNFCQSTSAQGLGRLSGESSRASKLVWLIFLLVMYVAFGRHLYTLIVKYNEEPVQTNTNSSVPFKFPDLYICPARTLTMSSAVNGFKDYVLRKLRKPETRLKDILDDLNFDMQVKRDKHYNGAFELKKSVLALSEILANVEMYLVEDFRMLGYVNGSDCRVTQSGEEYSGSARTVPVYKNIVRKRLFTSFNWSLVEPYASKAQCVAWNDAARLLKSQGVTLADQILAMNYSDSDNRCKAPAGLRLENFNNHATRPLQSPIGCYSTTGKNVFTTECLNFDAMTHEFCLECCYNRNYSYMALTGITCYCGTESERLNLTTGPASSGCKPCRGNSSQTCGGEGLLSVFQVQDSEPKPLRIPYGNDMVTFMEGPYCFYRDGAHRLSAYYCGIPYCGNYSEHNCVPSDSQSEEADRVKLLQYTGNQNVTFTGKACLSWNQVVKNLSADGSSRLYIRAADFDLNLDLAGDHNYCRAVSAVRQYVIKQNNGTYFFNQTSQELANKGMVLGCFIDNSEGSFEFEHCKIPTCYKARPSLTGVIRDWVGSTWLERQFSSDLSIGLLECYFANKKCSEKDFINVHHPEFGVCHRFINPSTTLNPVQLANAALNFIFFTDSTDSFGRTLKNISKMESAIHDGDGANYAFRVLIAPPGTYPRSADAIKVQAAQYTEVQLRFDKVSKVSTSTRKCNSSIKPVSYHMPHWKTNQSEDSTNWHSDYATIVEAKGWREKMAVLKRALRRNNVKGRTKLEMDFKFYSYHDCINEYKLQKFIDKCGCLPSSLPIPTRFLSKYAYCFKSTDTAYLAKIEKCYNDQMDLLDDSEMEALDKCQPMCESREYSIRQVSYAWPSLTLESSMGLLSSIVTHLGWKHAIKNARGVGSLYHTYLLTSNSTRTRLAEWDAGDILRIDRQLKAVDNRLAGLTVKAWTPFGRGTKEELSYTMESLVADLGGALGLWIGVSVLTAGEVAELILNIAWAVWLAKKKPAAPADDEAASVPLRGASETFPDEKAKDSEAVV